MKNLKLAIYGYQTDAAKALFSLLEEDKLPIEEIFPLAYNVDEYEAVNILDKNYGVSNPDDFDFSKCNALLFIGNKGDSEKIIPMAKEEGVIVIDARENNDEEDGVLYHDNLDDEELREALINQHIIPMNSSATLIASILKPLAVSFGLDRVNANLMEAVSGLSKDGAGELARETIALLNMRSIDPKLFSTQIAFNLHTQIGDYTADGSTTHENELLNQVLNVVGEVKNGINLTSVVVPVFYGHTLSLNITLSNNASIESFKNALKELNTIEIVDDEEITPTTHGVNEDKIFISRIREDKFLPNNFSLLAVIDNARIGLASNCLSILKALQKDEEEL